MGVTRRSRRHRGFPCEPRFRANLMRGGDFIVIDLPDRSIMAKLDVNLMTLLEIATTGTQALSSFGTCQGGG
jgi:hypothetical protein